MNDTKDRLPEISTSLSTTSLDIYLQELRGSWLLNHEQEIVLGCVIQAGQRAEKRLRKGGVSAEKAASLQRKIAAGQHASEQMAYCNTRLVVSIAKKYSYQMPLVDLIQEGNLGLLTAIKKYDPALGYRFSTYATWWIRQAVQRAVDNHGRVIRLPSHKLEKIRKVQREMQTLENELQAPPTTAQVAQRVGMKSADVEALLALTKDTLSLNSPIGDDGAVTLEDFIDDDTNQSADDVLDQQLLSFHMAELLDQLPPREAQVLRLRFGINLDEPNTLKQIGELFDLSRERVRQIETVALGKLRCLSNAHRLTI